MGIRMKIFRLKFQLLIFFHEIFTVNLVYDGAFHFPSMEFTYSATEFGLLGTAANFKAVTILNF